MDSKQLLNNTFPLIEIHFQHAALSVREKEKLIEPKSDSSLEAAFEKKSLIAFWANVKEEYPELSSKVYEHYINGESFFVIHIH